MAVGVRPLASVGAFPQNNFGRERPPLAGGCLTPAWHPLYAVPRQRQKMRREPVFDPVVCRKSAEDNPHAESQLQPACSGI